MSDVAYITNAAATLTFTAGSKTVTVTGTNPILEGVERGDRAVDPNGMELAIDVVAAGTLTLLRNAPTSGPVQFDVAPVSRLRTSLAANAEVTREVYAKLLAATEDNRSIPVISQATAPPGAPADGDRHLVIATATGVFAGKEGYIAQYDAANTRWIFIAPIAGMKVTVDGSAVLRIYTGAAWTVSGATAASEIAFTPTGGVAATTVQTAIAEVDSEKVTKASGTTAGRLWRFTDTAGGLGQSQMSEDGSGNVSVAGTLTATNTIKVGAGTGTKWVRADGGTGTAGGGAFLCDAGGVNYAAFGLKSAIIGGAFDNTMLIYGLGGGAVEVRCGTQTQMTWQNGLATIPNGDLAVARSNSGGAVGTDIQNTATGASAAARLRLLTGTANATVTVQINDNTGAPFAVEQSGSAVTGKYTDYALHVWRSQAGVEWARLGAAGIRVGGGGATIGAKFDGGSHNTSQTSAVFSARAVPNAFEWGHGNSAGYANTFGYFSSSGQPYIVFNGEAGSTVINTIRTRGVLARGIIGDNAGGMAWFTVANANADDQTVLTDMKLSASGRLVIGASTDTARLDVNGDVAHRMSSLTVANGANQNVSRLAFSSLRISAPTAAFNLGGLTGGADGIEVELINTTAHQMTLNNEDASSTAGNRITTDTGGNLNCKHAVLRYDATASRWRVISFRT